jgi:hypothetical protein
MRWSRCSPVRVRDAGPRGVDTNLSLAVKQVSVVCRSVTWYELVIILHSNTQVMTGTLRDAEVSALDTS